MAIHRMVDVIAEHDMAVSDVCAPTMPPEEGFQPSQHGVADSAVAGTARVVAIAHVPPGGPVVEQWMAWR
jgi:hypothetical protein